MNKVKVGLYVIEGTTNSIKKIVQQSKKDFATVHCQMCGKHKHASIHRLQELGWQLAGPCRCRNCYKKQRTEPTYIAKSKPVETKALPVPSLSV